VTLRQFLRELKASPCRFRIRRDGKIRTKEGRCPLHALAEHRTGRKFRDLIGAWIQLGLEIEEVPPVLFAADGNVLTGKERRLRKVFEGLCEEGK
jgi:hypothetical protein